MIRISSVVASVVLALSSVACGGADEPPDSGVRGVVTAGPQCPVVVQGSPCPDLPWQGTVRVSTTDGDVAGEVQTDDDGRFEIAVHAGEYELTAAIESGGPTTASPQMVEVATGAWAEVTLVVDTGIR